MSNSSNSINLRVFNLLSNFSEFYQEYILKILKVIKTDTVFITGGHRSNTDITLICIYTIYVLNTH